MNTTEKELLSIIVRYPRSIDHASDIGATHFTSKSLGSLWTVMQTLADAGIYPSDLREITTEAKRQGVWDDIGSAILRNLFETAPLPTALDSVASDLRKEHDRRRMRDTLRAALESLEHPQTSTDDVRAILDTVTTPTHDDGCDAVPIESLVADLIASVGSEQSPGITTGLPSYDRATGGLHRGELVIVAARPGVGKSALAAGIGLHAATEGRSVLFVSLEMTRRDIAARMVAGEAGISFASIRNGKATAGAMRSAAPAFEKLPFRVWSGRSLTVDKLRGVCRLNRARYGCDLIIVDYIGLITPTDRRKQRWEQVTEISNALKSLALTMDVPVLVLCQLNRDAEGERPKLSHLRESGAIEQDADVVALLHRDRDASDATLNIAKIRNGQPGAIPLVFDGPATRFSEPPSEFADWA